jgi:Xaa-Pro aminopeptidase
LRANVVIAVGNCGLYLGEFGVRVEDTMPVTAEGSNVLTTFPRSLTSPP